MINVKSKTTLIGAASIIAACVQCYLTRDVTGAATAITAGIGLLFARDE